MSATMPELLTAPFAPCEDNLSRNVVARIEAAKNRLSDLGTLYLVIEVAGQSQETLAAKRRDLLSG